jgi:hypothetical protein
MKKRAWRPYGGMRVKRGAHGSAPHRAFSFLV